MKNPSTPFTALTLTLTLVGLSTTARAAAEGSSDVSGAYWSSPDNTWRTSDGKVLLPDDFVGPPTPNQIRKSDAMKSVGPGLGSDLDALTDNTLLQISGDMCYLPPTTASSAKGEGWSEIPGANGSPTYVKEKGGKYIYALCAGIPCKTQEYDAKSCAAGSSCPAELKRYADSKDPAKMTALKNGDNMWNGSAGGGAPEKTPPATPQPDPVVVAANDLGNGIGSQFMSDFGSNAPGEDVAAPSAEVGHAQAPDVRSIQYTYIKVDQAAKKAEETVREVTEGMNREAVGRTDDLPANAAPSRRIRAERNQ